MGETSGTLLNKAYFKTNPSASSARPKPNLPPETTRIMDSPKLRKLPRTQLQSLAKRESVRAAGETVDILRTLLRNPPGGVPVPGDAPLNAQPIPPVQNVLTYDKDVFSGTESEMTEEEQLDFATPVSSRSETPPPANANDLGRCVTIMQQISAQDVALLKELTAVREIAAKLRKKARDVRELVKAENGRRERMETYFRYWQEVEPNWDRQWLYGEKMTLNGRESDKARKPVLSPEELKERRREIILRQEAEQRELEALRRKEMRGRRFNEEEPSQNADEFSKGEAELPPAEDVASGVSQ